MKPSDYLKWIRLEKPWTEMSQAVEAAVKLIDQRIDDQDRRIKQLEDEIARFWAIYQGDKHLQGNDDKGSIQSTS